MNTKQNMKTIYIAGKITGEDTNECWNKFMYYYKDVVYEKEKSEDVDIIIPQFVCYDDDTWFEAMEKCMEVVFAADKLYFLPDWKESKGATCEYYVAKALGKEIEFIEE